jgi:hypothetical protein
MRSIHFAWLPTDTIDGNIWLRWYKQYRSDSGTLLRIPFVLDQQYDAGVRREAA